MDITRENFPNTILDILSAITKSDFIALDCEFSGVSSAKYTSAGRSNKQTLQERYTETKEAAEKYQILQIGLTCCSAVADADAERNEEFTLSTYNFTISPILDEELEVQRDFAFQSGAVQFLLRNDFDFELPLRQGIRYLSRDEEAAARHRVALRLDKTRFHDIQLADTDVEALALLQQVRDEIDDWLPSGRRPTTSSLVIDARAEHELTGYDRRLVHQLVRTEYPDLVSAGKNSTVVIRLKDAQREAQFQGRIRQRLTEQVSAHIGFRWVIEALCGGDVADMDVKQTVARDADFYSTARQHAGVRDALRPAVIVGHNLFIDLVYIYACFIGKLPDKVEDFAAKIKTMFRMVIDTKYMATHDCGTMSPASSLGDLDQLYQHHTAPKIRMEAGFDKYETNNAAHHEAGFDSMITARVMLRLAAEMAETESVPGFEDEFWTPLANRLRVFGTVETVLNVDEEPAGIMDPMRLFGVPLKLLSL